MPYTSIMYINLEIRLLTYGICYKIHPGFVSALKLVAKQCSLHKSRTYPEHSVASVLNWAQQKNHSMQR
jgi:hypothetical protein